MTIQSTSASIQMATIAYSKSVSAGDASKVRETSGTQTADSTSATWSRSSDGTGSATYAKPASKKEDPDLAALLEDSASLYKSMRKFVEKMMQDQGYSISGLSSDSTTESGSSFNLSINLQISGTFGQSAATDALLSGSTGVAASDGTASEEDPWSAEAVSDRIVDFAKTISGGDTTKLNLLRDAIEEGFRQATKSYGSELPDISKQTYDLIQQKLDKWEKGDEDSSPSDTDDFAV